MGRHLQVALTPALPDAQMLVDPFDLREATALEATGVAGRPDACIHLAAIATLASAREDETRCWDVDLHGTLRLAHTILRHVPECQMLFASSADAYGGGIGGPIDERTPLVPRSLYAATKASAGGSSQAGAASGPTCARAA